MPVTAVSTGKISPARRVAFEVLAAVENGAYASDNLRVGSRNLEGRDAGLAAQIVFGCLRYQAQLDHLIFLYSGRSAEQLDTAVAIGLRIGIFQLRYLERIPAHAAVDETVELIKHQKRAAVGLANAVLRKVNRAAVAWPDRATELSCPEWLLARWTKHFSTEQAEKIAAAALEEPVAYVRLDPGTEPPHDVVLEPTAVAGCFRLLSTAKTGLRLHDIGSQAIVPLLDLQSGDSYLDVCAAPGNKTRQALETPLSLALACDISRKRMRELAAACPRVILDASRPLPFRRAFDRILIDAPCSGTGTLRRNPEIKWRVQEHDFARFAALQQRILGQGLGALREGGKLVYATCSLEQEENEDVVAAVLEARPEFRCEKELWRLPGRDAGDGFYAAVIVRRA